MTVEKKRQELEALDRQCAELARKRAPARTIMNIRQMYLALKEEIESRNENRGE